MWIAKCPGLRSIPSVVSVRELNLADCPSLEALPDDLSVSEALSIHGVRDLPTSSLPTRVACPNLDDPRVWLGLMDADMTANEAAIVAMAYAADSKEGDR
jgi:hypothetical protein